MYNKLLVTIALVILCSISIIAQESKPVIRGCVLDKTNKKAIPFANIYIPDTERGTITDVDGLFSMSVMHLNELQIRISCLGYATKYVTVKKEQQSITILLDPTSIELEEFSVKAKYLEKMGSDAKIDQDALEYIQPISIKDIFTLLPGGLIGSNNMQGRSLSTSRQAGSDQSTSFGMGISVDGIPMQNDGMRIQMGGYTGNSSIDPNSNVSVNTGTDLRTISTDHIESIIVTQGIASAKEGNLSSGSVKITSKKGKTPLRFRTKIDPLNKLAYVGKGFLISEKLGTLHTGIDITESASDRKNPKAAYNRITAQMNYNNQFNLLGKKIDFNLKSNYVTSFNDTKMDELIEENKENYKTKYEKYSLSSKTVATLEYAIIDELEFLVALDYAKDELKHNKKVQNKTVLPMQTATEEGEHEGQYLPASYYTSYKIENKPLTVFSSLNATKQGFISNHLNYNILLGTSLNYVKNKGYGAIVDPSRPPFPENSYIRARPNFEIPALINNASYLETTFRYKKGKNEINTSLGVRATQMLNLPKEYTLHGKMLFEPRLKASYTLRNNIGESHVLANTFRIGFGIENKLPSIDYLYPDKIYQDFMVLNAYFTEPEKRLLIINTKVHNPTNPKVRENKNQKIELGWDIKYDQYIFSLSIFRETMKGGIEYFSEYTPISYTKYNELKYPVTGKPSKEDFTSEEVYTFTRNTTPRNSAKVIKKGIEYRLNIPKLDLIKSNIEVNGAYYHTLYTNGVPVMERPNTIINGKIPAYIGIYDGFDKTYSERFNSNIWINTHIPKLKLIFTNFIQIIWLESTYLGNDIDIYPSKYMDAKGNIRTASREEIDKDIELSTLKRNRFSSARYNKEKRPISMQMNLKLTKEFNRYIKLSFFANNLLQISPMYETNFLQDQRDWHSPFFGTELIINL